MTGSRAATIRLLAGALLAVALAACSAEPTPDPTPIPTTYPEAPEAEAAAMTDRFADAWAAGDYDAMHAMLDARSAEAWPIERFSELHAAFAAMTRLTSLAAIVGEPELTALPPEPPSGDFPLPDPTPPPSMDPGATPDPSAAVEPTAAPSFDPTVPIPGPVPALAVPMDLAAETDRFGDLQLDRELRWTQGPDGWVLRWSPAVVFPELGEDGALRLDRELAQRGRILGAGGLVWAETRADGVRVYPQEALAGQVIGYVSEVTAEDLERLGPDAGYRAGDVIGRSGLESGAEALLRGTPGWRLVAVGGDGVESVLYETETVPGADLAITIRPEIQAAAQQALAPYAQAATAAVDPATGDVWALASQPAFNPNAMTLGTTLDGTPLSPAG
jgi:hypothetical protein